MNTNGLNSKPEMKDRESLKETLDNLQKNLQAKRDPSLGGMAGTQIGQDDQSILNRAGKFDLSQLVNCLFQDASK